MKNELKLKYENVLNKFAEKQRKNPNVIGILVSGSFVHSDLDKNSDLDVMIIIKDSKFRERGNIWIDGIEVEYFKNPMKQIMKELREKEYATAHMFSNSVIVYQKGNNATILVKEARKVLKQPQKKMNNVDIELAKYFIDDIEKDLEDMHVKKNYFAFEIISSKMLKDCLDCFYRIKRLPLGKPKKLCLSLEEIDKKFAGIYSNALLEKDMTRKFKNLKILVRYMEKLLGGKRSKEWKLRGKCEK